MNLTFRDNFFNSGITEIQSEDGQYAGRLDLKSAFGSSLDIYDANDNLLHSGKFRMMSNKWVIYSAGGGELGILRPRFSFFSKKYEFDALGRGVYGIESPVFSKEYTISSREGSVVAQFRKISGVFSSGTYELVNMDSVIDSYEWTAVVMGVHEIQKRQRNTAASSH